MGYQLYAITCVVTKDFYIGVYNQQYNPTRLPAFFYNLYKKGVPALDMFIQGCVSDGSNPLNKPLYNKLGLSIDKYGLQNHKVLLFKDAVYNNRLDAEMVAYERLILKWETMSDKILNDKIIDPTPTKCASCGMNVKKGLVEEHAFKYCKSINLSDF